MSPEWVWTLIASLGVIVAVWGALDARGNLKALGKLANGRRRVVKGDIRTELVRVAIQWSWLWVGISAIWAPGEGRWSLPVSVLVGSIAALLLNSLWGLWDRYALRRMA